MESGVWAVHTFETGRGEKPVDEFIKKQQVLARSKIIHKVNLLEQYGNMLGMPHAKILGSGIYELRIRGKDEIRIFYSFQKRDITLLHIFKKQTQKTPQKDLEIAIQRMESLTHI